MTILLYIIIAHVVPVVLRKVWLLFPKNRQKAEQTKLEEYSGWFPTSIYDYESPESPRRKLDRFYYRITDIPLWDKEYECSCFDLGPGFYYYVELFCFRYNFVFVKVEFWVRLK